MPPRGWIIATQDIDCLDRAKFRYRLPAAAPGDLLERSPDTIVSLHRFSRFTPLARDLRTIVKPGAFHCASVVGERELVVTFTGDPVRWPMPLMTDFAARLAAAGYGPVRYIRGSLAHCGGCPMRLGNCARSARSSSRLPPG